MVQRVAHVWLPQWAVGDFLGAGRGNPHCANQQRKLGKVWLVNQCSVAGAQWAASARPPGAGALPQHAQYRGEVLWLSVH